MSDWQPFRDARGIASPPVIGQASAYCGECRRAFPQGEMLFLNQSWVCAECKPVFLQRLREGVAPASGGVWRLNRQIVLRPNTPMPDRCVKCNAPANGIRLKRQLSWHPSPYYLLIFIGLLIYVIVALIVRKQAVVHIGLCEAHRARRRFTIGSCWLAALAGIVAIFGGANLATGGGWLVLMGITGILAALVVGATAVPIVSAAKIDGELVWIRGAGREFLDSLPEWNGPR
jgi:hypothetical protein